MSSYTLELRHLHETYKVFNFEYDFYCDNEVIKNNFEKKETDSSAKKEITKYRTKISRFKEVVL